MLPAGRVHREDVMSVFRTAMVWLGLVDDDEYDAQQDEYYLSDEYEEPVKEPAREPARVAPAARSTQPESSQVTVFRGRNTRDDDEPAVAPAAARSSAVKTIPMPTTRVHVMDPRGFNDAQEVGDRLKNGQPVILNLQGVDRDLQRRLIDFSSGLAYALSGTMSKAADQVFLLTPSNVEVSDEEKERLQARGLYRASHI
jgi:cell division inhibitor SepF